jgi:prolipoprotein diacylglyceryltransferase/pyruvate-formate lyase-activating enzyme
MPNWTYTAIMLAAVATGFALYRWTREPLGLTGWEKFGVALGAFCGGMLGAKLPFVLADWHGFLQGTAWFDDGKTIMSGLVGGYLGVQLTEWALGVERPLCDGFAVPLAAAVGIGRLACFAGGCCYGTITSLPWGIAFADGQPRHPTQLYESAFHLLAAAALFWLQRRGVWRGQLVRVYFVTYFAFRFATEFIRPEPAIWLGLTGYQWAALLLILVFTSWCCPRCRPQPVQPPQKNDARRFGAPVDGVLGKSETLCPTCLRPLTGTAVVEDGKVWLRRECPEHGESVALLSSDRGHYYLRDEVPHPPPAEPCCSAEPGHRTCLALLEVTDACNLCCPACYAQSPSGVHRPHEALCADLDAFVADRGRIEVLQLSGGEPLLHPDLLRIIDYCKTQPVDYVMVNTNGLELLRHAGLAAELARRRPRLELYLQLDGLDERSHAVLRGVDLVEQKHAVLDLLVRHDLPATLVCTVARGVNEEQIGPLLRLGMGMPLIRGVTFQPATWAGRFDPRGDPRDRVTLAEVIRSIAQQSGGLLDEDDFRPLPCGHPNCCSFAYALRRHAGAFVPLTRLVKYEDHWERLTDRMNFNLDDARQCCGLPGRPEDYFRVVVKPFMDAYTYQQERVDECCVHVIRPGGRAVSFCRFNILERAAAGAGVGDGQAAGTLVQSGSAQHRSCQPCKST